MAMEQQVPKDEDDSMECVDESTEFSAYSSDFAFNLTPTLGTKTLVPVTTPGQPSNSAHLVLNGRLSSFHPS